MNHRTVDDLTAQLAYLRAAPSRRGTLDLVVRRPAHAEREVLDVGVLHPVDGLVGDNWLSRATRRAVEAGRHLDAQLNVMSARMVGLLGETPEERAGAGDQLYLDLDLSTTNLSPGSRIALGDAAVIEVTAKPHNGCRKFIARFGEEAAAFVNSAEGKELRLRGLCARVVTGGPVRPGDPAVLLGA